MLDACVGRATERALEAVGADVLHVLDVDPRMDDRDVISLANSEDRLLITLDRRLSALVFVEGLQHAGVLLIREPTLSAGERAELTAAVLRDRNDELMGNFSALANGRLRIHKRGKSD